MEERRREGEGEREGGRESTLNLLLRSSYSLWPEEPASELAPEGEDTVATAVYQWLAVSNTGFSNNILDTGRAQGEKRTERGQRE